MMPLELARRCISLWSDVRGTVVDPFMGSGTSAVAAEICGRSFVGIENNSEYFDYALRRVSDHVSQCTLGL